ncbi:sterol desaturase family protein [Hyphobacterium indicum]|uniref:sterol desaturase family protein n=1 Tax=Hyphobacterium indicum TaxID=2162714 RepID=UPI000D6436FC|nr:sterol desaturase family protein [Hyphobacterium indicum]
MSDFLSSLPLIWAGIAATDLARYLVGALGVFLLINLALAGLLAGRKIRPDSPPAQQMLTEFFVSLRTVFIFATAGGLLIAAGVAAGWIDLYMDPTERGWLYFWASVVVLIVAHDAWFYWTHRLIHHPRLFRRVHRRHHRSNNPSPFTSYSFDVAEAVVNAAYLPLIVLILPVSPLAMLIFTSHMMLRNAVGHCGYELFPAWRGKPLFGWLTTVTHHDLHHAQAGWNFGLYFTFWDRVMGTEHPDYAERFAKAVRYVPAKEAGYQQPS